jgi:hypothetical protein
MRPYGPWPDGWRVVVRKPKREQEIRWQDLPREQQRRLVVLIGRLVRQYLAAVPSTETNDERDDAHPDSPVA